MRIATTLAIFGAAAVLTAPLNVYATCIGSSTLYSCTDASGNTYNVTRMGSTTMVNGHNPSTGSSWSQTSQRVGNTTFTNGSAANGNSWNSTTMDVGNGTTWTQGTDSRGRSFSQTCTAYGCF